MFPSGTSTVAGAEILFGSVKWPENTRGYQEMCGVEFWDGESEYEVSFGPAPRNGELQGSGLSGLSGYKSPFRGARPELTSDSGSPYP